jgi:hypothetical protein
MLDFVEYCDIVTGKWEIRDGICQCCKDAELCLMVGKTRCGEASCCHHCIVDSIHI